jgi:hypothetical protein
MLTAIAAAWACIGCGYGVTATDGTSFRQSESFPDAVSAALSASAARDLACASGDLEIQRLEPEREWAVTGCGLRAVYRVDTPSVTSGRIELVSRTALASAARSPAS